MPRSRLRAGFVALLAAAPFTAVHGQVAVPVQAPIAPGGPQPAKPDAAVAVRDGFDGLTFPEDGEARDARRAFEGLNDYLKDRTEKNTPWDKVAFLAQEGLLDLKSDYFYRPRNAAAGDPYLSIKAQTNQIISTFPKDGRQFYQLTYGPTAESLLKDAVAAGYDKAKLADVSQRYFHTAAGGRATLLLASLNLDTGHYAEAAFGFDRLLARPDSADLLTPRTLLKAAVAFKRAGDPKHAEAAETAWAELEKKFPRDGITVGRRAYTLDELRQEFTRPVELLFGAVGDDLVAMRYGNPSHTGRGVGGTPFLDPAFTRDLLYHTEGPEGTGADWVKQATEQAFRRLDRAKGQVALPGFFPVTAPNLILYRGFDAVYAVVTKDGFVSRGQTWKAGDIYWITYPSYTEGGLQNLMSGEHRQAAQGWWAQWQQSMPTLVFENAQVGSLAHDGKLVYLVDDLAVPPPPQAFNPNMGGFPGGVVQGGGSARQLTEYSRLVAVDLDTGKVQWSLGSPPGAPADADENKVTSAAQLTEGALFLGPPLPVNGKLYVLFERDQQLRLACLDPQRIVLGPGGKKADATPELLWVQKIGSPNVRLSQDSLRRIQPAYLAYADGVIVCPTNCGAVIAVDVNARSLLWARGYGATLTAAAAPANPNGVFIGGRVVQPNGQGGPLPNDRWRAAAPIIAGGKVIVTAHDANQIQCLDLRTGDLVWKDDRKPDDLYVGGVVNGRVIVVGKEATRAYDLAGAGNGKPALAWQNLRTGTPCGHGVVTTDGLFFLPMIGDSDHKDAKDPQVWAIDVARGAAKSKTAFRRPADGNTDPRLLLGNLAFHDGQMFSQSAASLTAFPLIELKKQEMDRLLAQNPKDPVGLTARGELQLDNGKIKEAVADFKEAEKNAPPEAVRRKIREKLYLAYTELLRNDFDGGEGVLSEYEALCEVPIDTDDPGEKARLMGEQVRRRGLFLSLVAKGRERQGRLTDAFKYYRAFAALGDNKQLVAIYDEPNSMTRPDVWARGRIDAMLRGAKDPAARKPLEDMVKADWEAVRDSNDLGRLREFVKVFGPYLSTLSAGRDAQLLLADRLVQTNNEDDAREAQVLLMQAWGIAEDAPTQARAVEALARVMTRRGMLEDAVGLYSTLGTKYATVVVKDGRTGADIYADLITDKRLLPYLEPVRSATTGKYKVDVQTGPANRAVQHQTFAVEPDGDLLPFFKRFRLAMEMNPNQNGTWVLKVTDRVTGEERCKFTDLSAIQSMNGFNQGPPSYRLAQASGHLVLLNIGQFAYCFDLAEKRELWRYDLFKRNPLPPNVPPQFQQDRDELLVSYEDGWTLRLGRSAVLEPTYACLVTRDGLVALDPITGQELWQRSNVSTKTQVFGDARHVFLVETTGTGAKSKVLRAVDGSVVEGAPDFAKEFTGPERLAVLGRDLLLADGGGVATTPTAGRQQPVPLNRPQPATPPAFATGNAPPFTALRLFDPFTGKDIWKAAVPEGSVVLKTVDPDLTGYLTPAGRFTVLESRTGRPVFEAGVDPDRADDHLKVNGQFAVRDPLVLADGERYFLFLNRAPDPTKNPTIYGYTMVKSQRVNGATYAFDRATGKRLWFWDRLFENQSVIVERFDDLPVLIAAAQVRDDATQNFVYQVAVVDKQAGRVKHRNGYPQNGFFVSMFADPKTRAIELWRYDLRLRIAPDEVAAAP